jgi:hypothetical protein
MGPRALSAPFVCAVCCAAFLFVCGARDARAGELGSELTISLLTMGPGDHPFYKFGHDAILVHDAKLHRDDVYNYGTFDYRSPRLISDFSQGRLRYWLSVQSLAATIAHYRAENRSILAQELALAPQQRRALADRLAHDALPENRYYRYDYYRDNCATRVRDAIDDAVGGRLRAASVAPAPLTYRGHTERLTADDLPVYLGLDLAMGDVIDRPITQWEEMFLPSMVEERVRHVTLAAPGADGTTTDAPLVARETRLLDAERAPLRETPPRWGLPMALAGATIGVLLSILGFASRTSRAARAGFGISMALVGLGSGVLGCIFVFFWVATDHYVAHHNENILQCFPLGLALAVSAVGLVRGSERAKRAVARITGVLAALSFAGLALKLLPWFDQGNGPIVALFLPVWMGAALGARSRAAVFVGARPLLSADGSGRSSPADERTNFLRLSQETKAGQPDPSSDARG